MIPTTLDADFVWTGESGTVHVECVANTDPEHTKLRPIRRVDGNGVTHLRYRVQR